MYNLNHLFTFMRVAELGSFNKYAEEEYISPNAVMKQINNLENELEGLKLFERTNRGIVLTETGEYLYREAKILIEECEASRQRVIVQGKVKNNTVRIAMPYYATLGYFKGILEQIHEKHPEIYLEIVSSGSNMKELLALWKNFGEWTDIACDGFADENPAGDYYGESFEYLTLAEKPMCCMMSTTHKLAQKEVIALEDFAGCELHIMDSSVDETMPSLKEKIENAVSDIKIVEHEYYKESLFNDCANGDGLIVSIGMDREYIVHPFIKTVPIEGSMMKFGLIYRKNAPEKVKNFIKIAKEFLKEQQLCAEEK